MPRGAVRRRQIAEIAERVFLTNGFADTTMSLVAEAAGASKMTLYRHFGSKEDLFAEVVRTRVATLNGDLEANLARRGDLDTILRQVGRSVLAEITSPAVVALIRMVAAEAPRDPRLGRIFHEHGPAAGVAALAAFLRREEARGAVATHDPELAANLFLSALIGHVILDQLYLVELPKPSPAHIEQRVEQVVAMFLSLCARTG